MEQIGREKNTTRLYEDTDGEVDTFGTYLDNIVQTPLLSAEEEVELAKDIEAGLYARHLLENNKYSWQKTRDLREMAQCGEESYNHFVEANLRLVVSIAGRLNRSSMEKDDLIQHGNMGLMHAVKKFNYTKGYKFSTYATWWITQRMHRAKHIESYTIALPEEHGVRLSKATNIEHDLRQELGREPTIDDIAAAMGVSVEKLEDTYEVTRGLASLNKKVKGKEGDTEFQDLLKNEAVDEYDPLERQIAAAACVAIVRETLTDDEFYVLRRRANGDTYTDIGRDKGMSREKIRQIANQAIKKASEIPELRDQAEEILS